MKDHTNIDAGMSEVQLMMRVARVMHLLRPVEQDMTKPQMVAVMQYVTGLLMAMEGCVFPEHPLHPNLQALADGFSHGVSIYNRYGKQEPEA